MTQKGAVSEQDVARVLAHMNDTGGYCTVDEAVIGDVGDVLDEHHSLFDVMLAELRQAGLTFLGPADESHPIFRRHRLNDHGKRIVAELYRRSRS